MEENKYEKALSLYNCELSDEEVRESVRKIIAEKVPQNDTLEVKKFLMGSVELTTLKTTDPSAKVKCWPAVRSRKRPEARKAGGSKRSRNMSPSIIPRGSASPTSPP